MSMNAEPKRLWLEALRSDEYKQGTDTLCTPTVDGDRHCCLGVACEVAVKAGIFITKKIWQAVLPLLGDAPDE